MTIPRVIGIGSHSGDDQAGWLIVDRLHNLGYSPRMLRKICNPVDLLDDMSSIPLLICDACQGPGDIGDIHRWQWPADALRQLKCHTTHDLPLAHVLELADQIAHDRIEAEVWGVTGSTWAPASQPCQAVQQAAFAVADQIWSLHGA